MATLTIADLDNGKRDLQTVDAVANSRAATATTRFGQQTTTLYEAIRRITATGDAQLAAQQAAATTIINALEADSAAQLAAQQTAAEEIIRNLGFLAPVPYAPGLEVTVPNFTVFENGVVYAAQPGEIPFTTAAWDASKWYPLQNQFTDNSILEFPDILSAETAAAVLPDGQPILVGDKKNQYSVVSGGLSFVRNYSRPVNALDYVFKTSDTDKTVAINEALVAAQGKALYFPAHPEGGFYQAQAGGLLIPNGCHIFGDCDASVIKSTGLFDAGPGAGMRLFDARNVSGWSMRDILLDLSEITNFPVAIRAIRAENCSHYQVENVHFKTPGAAIASLGCSDYYILRNLVDVISTDGAAHHDGVIDQWAGSVRFGIHFNRINGNGIPLYPILVTGTDSNNVATPSYDFAITYNEVYNTNEVAIWAQGRSGRVYDFKIIGNLVDGVTDYHGLAISEADNFIASQNITKRTARNGIRLFNENPSYGAAACRNGVLTDNIVLDANLAGLTGTNSEGAAIAVANACSGITLGFSRVKSGGHTYAAFLGGSTSNIEIQGEGLVAGSSGLVFNSVASNIVPGGSRYTPTVSSTSNVSSSTPRELIVTRNGTVVTVSGRIEVTPTASGQPTILNLSLPIASDLSDTNKDCSGSATSAFGVSGAIFANPTEDKATLQFQSTNTVSNSLFLRFTYLLR